MNLSTINSIYENIINIQTYKCIHAESQSVIHPYNTHIYIWKYILYKYIHIYIHIHMYIFLYIKFSYYTYIQTYPHRNIYCILTIFICTCASADDRNLFVFVRFTINFTHWTLTCFSCICLNLKISCTYIKLI